LSGKDFSGGADLSCTQLNGAWLNDCNLAGADLRHADLTGAHIDRPILDGALLQSAVLIGVSARGTSFVNAYLNANTDFTKADFRASLGPPIRPTIFSAVHMSPDDDIGEGAPGTMKAPGSRYDRTTIWPDFQPNPPEGSIIDDSIR
jgi:hypothetical protein